MIHVFQIVKEYTDEAISGLTDTRPGFAKMMEDARKGHFDVILAKNQSRFSRNFLHIEQYLHRELPHLNIRFIGVTDGVDTGKINNIAVRRSGKKTRQIYALVNEWYCQEISENEREILHQNVLSGEFIGSSAPFGYQKSPENPHKLILKEPEAINCKRTIRGVCGWHISQRACEALISKKHIHLQMLKQAGAAEALSDFSKRVLHRENSAGKDKDSQLQNKQRDTDSCQKSD